ncbi:MAG: transporter [Pseudomonadota bacterium]
MTNHPPLALVLLAGATLTTPALADQSGEELAKKLANPVAALISVPFQLNYDQNIGPGGHGEKWLLNIQPVVPIELNQDWNLISRTILPVVSQNDLSPGAGHQSGIGDIVQSLFFSPKAPTADGWIWGVGPVFLLPTGTDDLLTADKWGAGPTAVVLKQQGPWTYGALANHLWSFAGDDQRADISATFLQPFLSYTTPTAWTFSLNTESTYDWKNQQWSVPINGTVSKVTKIGGQLVSLGGGVRYWADSPDNGPEGLGFRLFVTLLFPK